MSTLTDILDRLTDIGTLRSQIGTLVKEQNELRSIMLQQQRDLAEVRGQLKAMIQMQSVSDKLRLK
jgi:Spy/CpxP family protein refolding chaperone